MAIRAMGAANIGALFESFREATGLFPQGGLELPSAAGPVWPAVCAGQPAVLRISPGDASRRNPWQRGPHRDVERPTRHYPHSKQPSGERRLRCDTLGVLHRVRERGV